MTTPPRRIVICGAAGRDFHNFNVAFRNRADIEVVAFTATQIPGIAHRSYPPALAGPRYPDGIPVVPESDLAILCRRQHVDEVVFAYSDVTHHQVMQVASTALAAGADFALLGPRATQIPSNLPVISVCAVRTGCGKSQIARHIAGELRRTGITPGVIRHPMPYGRLMDQSVQRFASHADLDQAACTLEEREEYEPHIDAGGVIFAGVDYGRILQAAEREADVIIWDGGNNDFPFLVPGLSVVVVDALRPGQLDTHHPGTAVLRMADLIVINKVDAARPEQVEQITSQLDALVPGVPQVQASSPVTVEDPQGLRGRRVLVIEDGPTITHGGMPHGAGLIAAQQCGAIIVDPRAVATPDLLAVFRAWPHIGPVLPAMGYDLAQREALSATIANAVHDAGVECVVCGTPIDLAQDLTLEVPVTRAHYRYQDAGEPRLMHFVERFLGR